MAEKPRTTNAYIKTLGCKVNSYDSAILEKEFEKNGYTIVDHHSKAQLLIINSCSVTSTAEKETRYLLRKFNRENPNAYRVVTGCYAQINSKELQELETPNYIVPNQQKNNLVSLVTKAFKNKDNNTKLPNNIKTVKNNRQSQFKLEKVLFGSHKISKTRAYIKIQDGCNSFCAYCQIPYARGSSKSVPSKDVLNQINELVSQGIKEIILTGIDIGDYGTDLKENPEEQSTSFEKLVSEVLKIPNLKRLRISSMEPLTISESFINLLHTHKEIFCDHFHIPLQSGSKRILSLMGRGYSKEYYYETVQKIRMFFPTAMISADVIPGFPGETEEEFFETVEFINKCKLAFLHVFPYSSRPNTRALRMPGHLDPSTIKQRAKTLRELSEKNKENFSKSFIGKKLDILWEKSSTLSHGKSKNYLNIIYKATNKPLSGSITKNLISDYNSEKKHLVVSTS